MASLMARAKGPDRGICVRQLLSFYDTSDETLWSDVEVPSSGKYLNQKSGPWRVQGVLVVWVVVRFVLKDITDSRRDR